MGAPLAKPLAELDHPGRIGEIRAKILGKPSLRLFYEEVYRKYERCLSQCPPGGLVLEIGSGGGFAKRVIPGIITSDTIPYDGIDRVLDATEMDLADSSVRAIFMMNVFHHIPDVEKFLAEAQRVLKPGGRLFLFDQHVGIFSRFILKYAHHEPFDAKAADWRFAAAGPLSGANGALAWIVFQRDIKKFRQGFPSLELKRYAPNTPLRYWLTGGLKAWSLLPAFAFRLATLLDAALVKVTPDFGSFVDVEIERIR